MLKETTDAFKNQQDQLCLALHSGHANAAADLINHSYKRQMLPLAQKLLRNDRQSNHLEADDLVTAVYEALLKAGGARIENFSGYAREVMRNRILAEARNGRALKRGGNNADVPLDPFLATMETEGEA